jgi:hypothetical protein
MLISVLSGLIPTKGGFFKLSSGARRFLRHSYGEHPLRDRLFRDLVVCLPHFEAGRLPHSMV